MKICFLANTLSIDRGWGRYSWEIIKRVAERDDVQAVVLTEHDSGRKIEKPLLRSCTQNASSFLRSVLAVRRCVKNCGIIHCMDAYPYGIIGALANIGIGKKLVIGGVGTYSVAPLEQRIKSWLLRWAYRQADSIPCISSFVEKEICKRVRLINTQVITLGIDFDRFHTAGCLQNRTSQKMILSVGALKGRKGYHISIPAVGLVKKQYPDLRYCIVGHQDNRKYLEELRRLIEEYKLEENVFFLERITDEKLICLYHQSDLFLLTPVNMGAHFEGFGLVYLEANACGKPVIGTYGCGAEDAIKDGVSGLLVPQNDIQKTAEAVVKLLDNDYAKKMKDSSIEWAKSHDWSKVVARYLSLYCSL